MKNLYLSIIITLIVMNNSCTHTNPLDQWAVGTSNRDKGQIQAMSDNGLTCMEAGWPNAGRQSPEEIEIWAKELKTTADKCGVAIWSVHIPFGDAYDISNANEAERQKAVAVNIADMEAASRLLAPKYFVVHPSYEPITDEERPARLASCRKSLRELAAKAKACNVVLLFECLPRTCLGNTSTELLNLIDGVDNTGICFDVNHLLQESHVAFVRNAKGKIKSTHMSDYDGNDEKHWLPGKGVINWTELLKELVATGYTGPFMYEVSRGNPPTISIEDLAQCWKKLKEDASK